MKMVRLTRAGSRAVDRFASERYRIPSILLMENAARCVAREARALLKPNPADQTTLIVCGGGNNGGDGLACARHLRKHGIDVQIALTVDPQKYSGDALTNWEIVQAMDVPRSILKDGLLRIQGVGLIIDAIFGTGLSQPPRPPFGLIVETINGCGVPVLAIDLPSGLDCDTGRPLGPCVRATRTVTFVTEKAGFANPASKQYTGEIAVGDIGVPAVDLIELAISEVPGSFTAE